MSFKRISSGLSPNSCTRPLYCLNFLFDFCNDSNLFSKSTFFDDFALSLFVLHCLNDILAAINSNTASGSNTNINIKITILTASSK